MAEDIVNFFLDPVAPSFLVFLTPNADTYLRGTPSAGHKIKGVENL